MAKGLEVGVDVIGLPRLDRAFKIAESTFERFIPVIEPVFDRWFNQTEFEQFNSGGAKGEHGSWAELRESTKERRGFGGFFPLQDTNALRLSLTQTNARYSVREVSANSMVRGTTRPGAMAHQHGFTARDGSRVPARRPIDPSRAQLEEFLKGAQRAIRVPLREAGFVERDFDNLVG